MSNQYPEDVYMSFSNLNFDQSMEFPNGPSLTHRNWSFCYDLENKSGYIVHTPENWNIPATRYELPLIITQIIDNLIEQSKYNSSAAVRIKLAELNKLIGPELS